MEHFHRGRKCDNRYKQSRGMTWASRICLDTDEVAAVTERQQPSLRINICDISLLKPSWKAWNLVSRISENYS